MQQLIRRGSSELGCPTIFSDRIIEAAQEYHWPGNLRELRSFVTRTLILQDEESAYNDLRAKTRASAAYSTGYSSGEITMESKMLLWEVSRKWRPMSVIALSVAQHYAGPNLRYWK
jgi:DNA-binding NtrC family response regulator